jgi:hypothetical protein
MTHPFTKINLETVPFLQLKGKLWYFPTGQCNCYEHSGYAHNVTLQANFKCRCSEFFLEDKYLYLSGIKPTLSAASGSHFKD